MLNGKGSYHLIKIKTSCHNRCFSLGFHIDFKNRYIDFHIWNWFIEIGNHDASYLKEPYGKKLKELWDEYSRKQEAIVKFEKDFHPLSI